MTDAEKQSAPEKLASIPLEALSAAAAAAFPSAVAAYAAGFWGTAAILAVSGTYCVANRIAHAPARESARSKIEPPSP